MALSERLRTVLGREVRHYPNVIEIWQDGDRVIAFTPEEWGQMVAYVGIGTVSRARENRVSLPDLDELTGNGPLGY